MSKSYPLPDDDFSSTSHDRPKYYSYQDFKGKYHIDIVPFIGERGNPTSIRFVLLEQPLHITMGLTNMILYTPMMDLLETRYALDLKNDIILVKDALLFWDLLIYQEDEFSFQNIHSKDLDVAKNKALQYFFEREVED